ncbi:HlyD family efflux transporter periplasmic adaptor subunit [Ligilactobacillus salivarius]|uniref:HlyD family efflux transporter periplasmic adaptor subunit n=1 Tax=Ligilactobacillus salivarius TaxID=1624 RepID=UPI0009D93270|nr:HlyD family efflux transporter periplasmic adaptor subunit [Ligilactobacillus salivarius]MDE1499143.1 HlyD family efflux transporter periplasmic adaptor subunit [Ligilactobacillus salivarius]MDE1524305.1 HlyD family efflux transporter periplasmic adaptor subunit [Ligilactobacillus salivarius]MDE1526101.1 HlyD family efflux transporter periplasmic adaptor subunit [Ligilactobacillus salivarius]MDL1931620.1 HlyD family efflux transporter periplasmic adaptor subunit [Ligilactobacillus salivarius
MEDKFLESSEFYSARFRNFSTMIIIPFTILLLAVVIFSFFGKKEITIQGAGTLEALGNNPVIQSTVNSPIEKNYLKEGKYVKKGDTLLVYNNVSIQDKGKLYNSQKEILDRQLAALNLLKQGVQDNHDSFGEDDEFGYRNDLKSYLQQRNTYLTENTMIQDKSKNDKAKQSSINNELKKQGASSTSIAEFDSSKYNIEINNQKMSDLQSSKLSSIDQEIIKIKQNISELNANIDENNNTNREYKLKAVRDGILHINDEYSESHYISAGANLAQILPILKNQKTLKVKAYISTVDISSIKVGQKVRFKVTRNVPKPIILTGKIYKISISPVEIGKENYYQIEAKTDIENTNKDLLKYGMQGRMVVITGKTTFFEYYKNKLFNIKQ